MPQAAITLGDIQRATLAARSARGDFISTRLNKGKLQVGYWLTERNPKASDWVALTDWLAPRDAVDTLLDMAQA